MYQDAHAQSIRANDPARVVRFACVVSSSLFHRLSSSFSCLESCPRLVQANPFDELWQTLEHDANRPVSVSKITRN